MPDHKLLGADRWAGSRMAVDENRYTGEIGFLLRQDRTAVRELAASSYDLSRSHAYSNPPAICRCWRAWAIRPW